MKLYWHWVGPLMQYDGEYLYIEDLNPQTKTAWAVSRWRLFKLGIRAIAASVFAR
jgi:hypothetical protein